MTKEELKKQLEERKTLQGLFQFSVGQECLIFKALEFQLGSDIIYISDISLHEIPDDCPITEIEDQEQALSDCYSGDDFVNICSGDVKLAKQLFDWCDWQSPEAALPEVIAAYADESLPAFLG